MEFSLRCRCSSLLQVVAIIMACYRGKVSSVDITERVQGCVGSRLSLNCPEMKVIEVTDVVIGDSACLGTSCCIRDSDCTGNANANHVIDVHSRCDGQSSCIVDVVREEFGCGYLGFRSQNDFERITYNCRNDSRRYILTRSTSVQLTPVIFTSAPDESGDEELTFPRHAAPDHADSATFGIVIILCVVCLIVIIAVAVTVAIVTVRRKKRRQVKSSDAIKKSDLETDRKEVIYMNVNGQTVETGLNENTRSSAPIYVNGGVRSLETRTSDYCEIEGVTSEGMQSDSQYEKLDHRRNYEPLIVYQQLQ